MRAIGGAIAAVTGAALGAGCGSDGGDFRLAQRLDEAQARWEGAGVSAYTVTQSRSCECLPPSWWSIAVSEDGTIAVVDVHVPAGADSAEMAVEAAALAMTVEDAFAWIARSLEGSYRVDASFDPVLGYPTGMYIDRVRNIADDEEGWSLDDFQVAAAGAGRPGAHARGSAP